MAILPDGLARFARGHLHSAPEHAVYRTVGSDPVTRWTAAEIAAYADLDVGDVDRALRRFAAARILTEHVDPRGRRCYQWRTELCYLFDGTTPRGLIDPVCGMPIEADSPYSGSDATGDPVRFCSAWCKATYRSGIGR